MTEPTMKMPNPQPPDSSKVDDPAYAPGPSVSSRDDQSKIKDNQAEDDLKKLESDVKELEDEQEENVWLTRSIQAFTASQSAFKEGIQDRLINSLKAYNSQHTANTALYLGSEDLGASISIRPKVKSLVKKDVASADASFFKNSDVVSIEAENPSDKAEVLSARLMKQLVNYRFTKFIPWKLKCLGAYKQALIQGQVCAHIYWDVKQNEDGSLDEKPCIDIIPLENVRFDRACDPTDVVGTSPYFIVLKNMYIGDIKEMIRKGQFLEVDVSPSSLSDNVSVSKERNKDKDPYNTNNQSTKSIENQTALVMMHVHRIEGTDWIWYTLNNTAMLTDPKPLKDLYFHGHRPFVIGYTEIELGSVYPSSFVEDLIPVYEEMNILANQSRRAIDQAISRKWRVDPSAGEQFDPRALLSDESIVFAAKDGIEPLNQNEIPPSSFQSMSQLEADLNELAGNYNPQNQAPVTSKQPGDAFRTHQMLNTNANILVETRIANFAMTFVEPVIRQIILLEQYYETDDVIIGLAGQQCGLFQKFGGKVQWSQEAMKLAGVPGGASPQAFQAQGMPQPQAPAPQGAPMAPGAAPAPGGSPMDLMGGMGQAGPPKSLLPPGALPEGIDIENLLRKELTIKVNVGMNASDPQKKRNDLIQTFNEIVAISGGNKFALNFTECAEELFAVIGYGDGKRFLNQEQNPQVLELLKVIQQLQMQLKTRADHDQAMLQKAHLDSDTKKLIKAAEIEHDSQKLVLDHAVDQQKMLISQQPPTSNNKGS